MHKSTDEVWDNYSLAILVVSTLFCMHKSTGEVYDPQWGLRPAESCNAGLKSLFYMHKATGEGWNPYRHDIVVLSTLLCVHESTDEVWDT